MTTSARAHDVVIGAVERRAFLCAICIWMTAAACGDSGDRGAPRADASPISLSNCIEASTDRLPYSFCVPETWRVGDILHMDGSIDIVMIDEGGEAFGFGEASGPTEPSGRVKRFVPFPESSSEPRAESGSSPTRGSSRMPSETCPSKRWLSTVDQMSRQEVRLRRRMRAQDSSMVRFGRRREMGPRSSVRGRGVRTTG